jgi:nicotinate-nucleotide pyrophosphorylase (carboxylating)
MPLNKKLIQKTVVAALVEDAAYQDITTLDFIPAKTKVEAGIIVKEKGIVCGIPVALEVFKAFDPTLSVRPRKSEGAAVSKGDAVFAISGSARSVLSCERVALNFLSYLSGIASAAFAAVSCVRAQGIQILDTRKTTPLLRPFEKYAVLVGRGKNHRLDLSDQYLVKDNHVFILERSVGLDVLAARRRSMPFEIEVDSLRDFLRALKIEPDIVMLDNFSPLEVKKAVALLKKRYPKKSERPLLELSGGITPENIRGYAIKGVDFISLGALTHSAKALDFSLEITRVSICS